MEKITRAGFGTTIPLTSIVCQETVYVHGEMTYMQNEIFAEVRDKILNGCNLDGSYDVQVNIGDGVHNFGGRIEQIVYSNLESSYSLTRGWENPIEREKVELTFEEFQRLGRPKQLRRKTIYNYIKEE